MAPNAFVDYTQLIAMCREGAAKELTSRQFVTKLGVVLMRAGQYTEASQLLEQSLSMPDGEKTSQTYSSYFLAMTQFHQGNKEASQRQLQIANMLAEKELAESPKWNRQLTIELLRKEAQLLIGEDK